MESLARFRLTRAAADRSRSKKTASLTARKHLKAERTRTGKRIEHAGALDTFGQRTLEHRGDGLAHGQSVVGRLTSRPLGLSMGRPRHSPQRSSSAAYLLENISIARNDFMAHGHGSASSQIAGVSQQFLSVLMGGFDRLVSASRSTKRSATPPCWRRPTNLALMPESEVHLGELEPVIGLCQRLEALPRRQLRSAFGPNLGQDIAGAGIRPSSHATAQLMQGGQTKPLAVLDEHDGGVGQRRRRPRRRSSRREYRSRLFQICR